MQIEEFQVRRDDLSKSRLVKRETGALLSDDVLLKVERFGLTANNITYGVVGDKFGYWNFFPAKDGWGIIPAWGIGEVVETKHPDVKIGERVYGYFPIASHLAITAGKVGAMRLVDVSEHRAGLAPVYNNYARLASEPGYERALDDERIALLPLYATSYCLYDFLVDNKWFGAEQVIIPSASSKTSIGLAYALHHDKSAPRSVGVTSAKNLAAVKDLALYDSVVAYDAFRIIDAKKPAVIVDMSGNGAFLSELHAHLGDNMKFCSTVGVTHWDAAAAGPGFNRDRTQFFFAPGHIQKRASDWGPAEFEKRAHKFWREAAIKSRDWLTIERHEGAKALEKIFHQLRLGKIAPDRAIVVTL